MNNMMLAKIGGKMQVNFTFRFYSMLQSVQNKKIVLKNNMYKTKSPQNNISRIHRTLLGRLNIKLALVLAVIVTFVFGSSTYVIASSTSNFTQTINAGTLGVDIVDAAYSPVGSPTMAMGAETFSLACQTATGAFGTASEQVYVTNPDAADGGWSISAAASGTTDVWDSTGTDYDFNDPGGSGCTDGADADSLGGQMTVDPSGATLDVGQCSSCVTTNVSLGSSNAFNEGTTDTITISTGAATSDDIGDWTIENVSISQQVPAEQPAAADYDINIVMSIAAL